MLVVILTYIVIGIGVSLSTDYYVGDRDHATNTIIDVLLWPVMIYYWVRYR